MNTRTFRFPIVLVTLLALVFGAQGVTPARSAADSAPASTASNSGQWTWVDGSKNVNQTGTYGTEDVPNAANVPGARWFSVSWRDASGNLWLFGGWGYDSAGNFGKLNDLWKFDPATGQWTWIDGSNLISQIGIYGTKNVSAAANVPGARRGSISWIDASGNLWLFGGNGYDSIGIEDRLNDLWKFNPATGEWTWVDGSNTVNHAGVYGTEDVSAAGNVPGSRQASVSWIDASGNLWLFGGSGYDSIGIEDRLNDLWKFDPATGEWTWVDGSNTINQIGTYGTEDIPAAANVPGARYGSVSWSDASGNLWLFGGLGLDTFDRLNDLWKFNPATGQWTWVDGSNAINQTGTYGTEDVPAAANVPGARQQAHSWMDASGNLWLFGGMGLDSAGGLSILNDLWKFDPATEQWTWVDGSKFFNQPGTYGTEDVPAAANVPGARYPSASWIDSSGNLWLFGGFGYDSAGNYSNLNDLWKFSDVASDTTPPVVTVPSDMTVEATGPSGAVAAFSATATDETSPANPAVTCVPPSGSTFPLGTTPVTCSATDDASNTGYGYFNVTVEDNTAPTLNLPADITVPQSIPAGAVVSYIATATDLVDGSVAVNCTPPSGATFPVGTTNVDCQAIDTAGNAANGSFNVTVGIAETQATFTSLGAYDGILLELNETSGTGGTGNASGGTINIGDSFFRQQQLGLLHFDTSSLPDNAVVTGISIQMKLQGTTGTNPFTTHGSLLVDIASPFFGTLVNLQAADFQAASSISGVGAFNPVSLAGNWYNADLGDSAFPLLNLSGPTQFRIGFSLGDDNDSIADLLKFYSGNSLMTAYRPVLIVYYYIP